MGEWGGEFLEDLKNGVYDDCPDIDPTCFGVEPRRKTYTEKHFVLICSDKKTKLLVDRGTNWYVVLKKEHMTKEGNIYYEGTIPFIFTRNNVLTKLFRLFPELTNNQLEKIMMDIESQIKD